MTLRTLATLGVLLPVVSLSAQQRPAPKRSVLEARVDAFASRAPGVQGAIGVAFDAEPYVRFALLAGAGAERRPGGAITAVQRVEGVARYHFDPYRQSGRGVYAAGGIAVRHAAGSPLRPLLVALIGLELAPRGRVATAIEGGVGGGARLGVALRQARAGRR